MQCFGVWTTLYTASVIYQQHYNSLTLWRPRSPYGYSYKTSCACQTVLSRRHL